MMALMSSRILCVVGTTIGLALPQLAAAEPLNPLMIVASASDAIDAPIRTQSNPKTHPHTETRVEPRAGSVPAVPQWIPRKRGTPAARTGGATRNISENLVVRALVPRYDEAGVTYRDQPTFYWHISADTRHSVNFTLIDPEAIDPILDTQLEGPFETGIHAIDLRRYSAKLDVGKQYLWHVAVVADPARRSFDIIARGAVRRLNPEPGLESALRRAQQSERVSLLARQGIWYDALEAASAEGDFASMLRDALLEQAGLESIAKLN